MNNEKYFLEKNEKMLFLEIKKGSKINNYSFQENVYLPVNSDDIVNRTKAGDNMEDIPVNLFIEGMFFVLGADPKFRYNGSYKKILKAVDGSDKYIKGKIFDCIKHEKYEDAYIMLKGLIIIEFSKDNCEKAMMLCESLRKINKVYNEELEELIIKSKSFEDFAAPYYYETILNNDKKNFEDARFTLNQYIALGGKVTEEIEEMKNNLDIVNKFSEAKEIVYDDPKKALELLLPLLDTLGDKVEVYYYIAVAYRILESHEKAIFYLNDALAINSDYVEVYNELGINYACIQNYERAIEYFRRVFEVTKALEVCTNLIMCYMNINDMKQAKAHLEIAKKLNPDDEIVKEIEKVLK